jgi:endo-1,4-beta-xylanase
MSLTNRRNVLTASGALAISGGSMRPAKSSATTPTSETPGLKAVAPFPMGTCLNTTQFNDPKLVQVLTKNFSQITPEWQMKMDYIQRPDGSLNFDACDTFMHQAEANGLRVHGHTLIWWLQSAPYFAGLTGSRVRFEAAYGKYISDVVSRYRGRIRSWDVVNECVARKIGYRDCIWSQNLSTAYIGLAFQYAKAADRGAILFLNDHSLESNPRKRRQFIILVESLLKQGIPLDGIGSQTHIETSLPSGALRACLKDLSSCGLPIHVSEFDVSIPKSATGMTPELLAKRASLIAEAADAYQSLPASQRYGFTTWGLRDSDCFDNRSLPVGAPPRTSVFLNDEGRPNAGMKAFVDAIRR